VVGEAKACATSAGDDYTNEVIQMVGWGQFCGEICSRVACGPRLQNSFLLRNTTIPAKLSICIANRVAGNGVPIMVL
jgi:hypothetical protein